jgi:uncharacterized protein
MTHAFASIAFTPAVRAAQERDGSRSAFARAYDDAGDAQDALLGAREAEFIAAQRSFCMATVSETGWPYVQHRGGPPGFLQVVDAHTLAFADYAGNRQMVSVGNLATNDRVALILIDYAQGRRLKVLGHLSVDELAPEQAKAAAPVAPKARVQRMMRIAVAAFDWNCPQHIPQRFEAEDVQRALEERNDEIRRLRAAREA